MESNKLSKILTIVAVIISLIGVFFLVRIIMVGDDAIKSGGEQGIVSGFYSFALFILVAVTLVTLVLSLINLFRNPQSLKRSLIGLAILGVLLMITYFMADGSAVLDPFTNKVIKDGEAGSISKWVSALINFTGLLGLAGIVAILLGVVRSAVK